MKCTTLCLMFILIPTHSYLCTHIFTKFERRSDLDGFTCSPQEKVFDYTYSEFKLAACVAECAVTATCLSVFYHIGTGQCNGCNGLYNVSYDTTAGNLDEFPGTHHYEKKVCPTGWIGWKMSCYKATNTYNSFYEGAAECATYQGHAVYIDNEAEFAFLRQSFDNEVSPYLYLGIYYNTSESRWVHYETNQMAAYTIFEDSAGTNPGEDCTIFCDCYPEEHVLADYTCSGTAPTLCEIDL